MSASSPNSSGSPLAKFYVALAFMAFFATRLVLVLLIKGDLQDFGDMSKQPTMIIFGIPMLVGTSVAGFAKKEWQRQARLTQRARDAQANTTISSLVANLS